jgi:uncharacterized membrane protein SirB2
MLLMEGIKQVHVACVVLTGSGFFLRGILMMRNSGLLQARIVKIAPHIVDTVLLVTAIALASQWGWTALQMPWLLAKIVGLLVYIVLGTVALRRGRTRALRISAWLAALGVFFYIIAVAITRNPLVLG